MREKLVLIVLLVFVLYLSGCAGDKVVRLENQQKTLQGQVEGLDEEMTTMTDQMKSIQDSQKKVSSSADNIEKRLSEIAAKLQELEEDAEEPDEIEEVDDDDEDAEEAPAPVAKPAKPAPAMGAPKIKVLSGNANMPSAIQMARKLESLGFKVDRVDFAPRSNFFNTTVFYSSGGLETANAVVNKIGCAAVTKQMTWPSMFDIIVVTGHK